MRGTFLTSYVHGTIRYIFFPPHCLANFVGFNINIYSIKKRCNLPAAGMAAEDIARILDYNTKDGATSHYRENGFSWRKTTNQWVIYHDSNSM